MSKAKDCVCGFNPPTECNPDCERCQLIAELARVTAERDRLIELHIERGACEREAWDILIPASDSPIGWAWWCDIDTKQDAIAAFRQFAGLDPESQEVPA